METNHTYPLTTTRRRNYLERDEAGNYLPGDPATGRPYTVTPIPVGSPARVVRTESHGSNPWTRYTLEVVLPDGRAVISAGHCPGEDGL